MRAAKARIVARTDEDRSEFLRKRRLSKAETAGIIAIVLGEEERRPSSIFDFAQNITAVARGKAHQDSRLEMEPSRPAHDDLIKRDRIRLLKSPKSGRIGSLPMPTDPGKVEHRGARGDAPASFAAPP